MDVTKGPRRVRRRAGVGGRSQLTEQTLLHENSVGQDRQVQARDMTLDVSICLLARRDQSLCGEHTVSAVLRVSDSAYVRLHCGHFDDAGLGVSANDEIEDDCCWG